MENPLFEIVGINLVIRKREDKNSDDKLFPSPIMCS